MSKVVIYLSLAIFASGIATYSFAAQTDSTTNAPLHAQNPVATNQICDSKNPARVIASDFSGICRHRPELIESSGIQLASDEHYDYVIAVGDAALAQEKRSEAVTVAKNRARAEIARFFKSDLEAETALETTQAEGHDGATESTQRRVRLHARETLKGTQPICAWDSADGSVHFEAIGARFGK